MNNVLGFYNLKILPEDLEVQMHLFLHLRAATANGLFLLCMKRLRNKEKSHISQWMRLELKSLASL